MNESEGDRVWLSQLFFSSANQCGSEGCTGRVASAADHVEGVFMHASA